MSEPKKSAKVYKLPVKRPVKSEKRPLTLAQIDQMIAKLDKEIKLAEDRVRELRSQRGSWKLQRRILTKEE